LKTDNLVNQLNKKLEEKYPSEVSQDYKQDGINTWKGKRILPVDQWIKMTASLENEKVVFDLSKGLNAFPDSTSEVIFQYGVEGSEEYYKVIPREEFDKWFHDYLNFLAFKKSTELGNMICKNCLLSPHKDRSGLLIGVHKMVAKLLQEQLKVNKAPGINLEKGYPSLKNISETSTVYPCNVQNYFACPYECKNDSKKFKHNLDSDIQYLFELDQITGIVDVALLKASSMTRSNETIYEIDMAKNSLIEIETLYSGKQYCMAEWSPIGEGLPRIMKPSVVPVRNSKDILEVLKDRNRLDLILKQYLAGEEYKEVVDKILRYFEKNGRNLDMAGYYKHTVFENKYKQKCRECDSDANIHLMQSDVWLCSNHYQLYVS
jgi:hypothetical protein